MNKKGKFKKTSVKSEPPVNYTILMIEQGAYVSTSKPWTQGDFRIAIKKQLDEVDYYSKLYH